MKISNCDIYDAHKLRQKTPSKNCENPQQWNQPTTTVRGEQQLVKPVTNRSGLHLKTPSFQMSHMSNTIPKPISHCMLRFLREKLKTTDLTSLLVNKKQHLQNSFLCSIQNCFFFNIKDFLIDFSHLNRSNLCDIPY